MSRSSWPRPFPLIIGAAGLAVDGTEWVVQKRAAQAAADSAAMAGVYGLIAGQGMEKSVNRSIMQERRHSGQRQHPGASGTSGT